VAVFLSALNAEEELELHVVSSKLTTWESIA
jgi:hypothetical protein